MKNLLLTGAAGCGKSTALERTMEHLSDLRLAGFLTLELREHGHRVGFEAVGLGGLGPSRIWFSRTFGDRPP